MYKRQPATGVNGVAMVQRGYELALSRPNGQHCPEFVAFFYAQPHYSSLTCGRKFQGGRLDWSQGNRDVAPPKYGVQEHCPRKFLKFNVEICAVSKCIQYMSI